MQTIYGEMTSKRTAEVLCVQPVPLLHDVSHGMLCKFCGLV